MATKTRAKPKPKRKTRPRSQRPLSRQQLLELDPWHFDRREDPVFRAILKVLIDHPHVSYYSVDWRPWLERTKPPAGRPVPNADAICASMFVPYNEVTQLRRGGIRRHGGGYLERFASGVVDMAVGAVVTLPDGTERTLTGGGCGRAGIDYRAENGYRKWKRLPNGIDVWVLKYKATYATGRRYEARYGAPPGRSVRAGHIKVGTLSLPDGAPPTGEIAGLYSYVQGRDAPCTTPEAWVEELAKLQIGGPPEKISDAIIAVLRRNYRFEVDGMARIAAQHTPYRLRQLGRRSTPRWGFERLMRECGFTKRVLARFDREVERQRKLLAREQAKAARAAKKEKGQTPTLRRKPNGDANNRVQGRGRSTEVGPGGKERRAPARKRGSTTQGRARRPRQAAGTRGRVRAHDARRRGRVATAAAASNPRPRDGANR